MSFIVLKFLFDLIDFSKVFDVNLRPNFELRVGKNSSEAFYTTLRWNPCIILNTVCATPGL